MPQLAHPTRKSTTNTEAILDQILFVSRVRQIIRSQAQGRRFRITFELFLTDIPDESDCLANPPEGITIRNRRIEREDLVRVVSGSGTGESDVRSKSELEPQPQPEPEVEEKVHATPKGTVCYVCGPPPMADEIVRQLKELLHDEGEDKTQRVFCEKWW